MPLAGGQCRLCGGRADSPKEARHGQAQMPGEIGGLVETALTPSRWVQGNRHDGVGTVENPRAAFAHTRSERACDRSPRVVLQRVDDGSESAVVLADRTPSRDPARHSPASRATSGGQTDRARQRIAADLAKRRRERLDRSPALGADRSARRFVQRFAARRAGRCQQDGEQAVKKCPNARRARRYPTGVRARRRFAFPARRCGR